MRLTSLYDCERAILITAVVSIEGIGTPGGADGRPENQISIFILVRLEVEYMNT
jgi:hypothetical protein